MLLLPIHLLIVIIIIIEAPDGMYLKGEYKNLKQVDIDNKFNIKSSALEDNKLVLDYEHAQKDAYIIVCAVHKEGKEKTLTARARINQDGASGKTEISDAKSSFDTSKPVKHFEDSATGKTGLRYYYASIYVNAEKVILIIRS